MPLQVETLVLRSRLIECGPPVILLTQNVVVVVVDVRRVHFEIAKCILFYQACLDSGAIVARLVIVHFKFI